MRGAFADREQLQAARVRCGLSQEQLADLAGLDVKTVRKAERGRRLDLSTLARLARALQTEPGRLVRTYEPEAQPQARLRELVMSWLIAWDAQDGDRLVTFYHEHATLWLPGGPNIPFHGVFRGRAEIRKAHETAWSTCRTVSVRDDDLTLHVSDNLVLLQGHKGVYLPDGSVARLAIVQIFTFDGPMIVEQRVEYDTLHFAKVLDFPPGAPAPGEGS